MDLRAYYGRIRGVESEIAEEAVVVVSRGTSDGGKAGVRMDVPRAVAARMVVDGKAELSDGEDAIRFRAEVERRWRGGMNLGTAERWKS